jgi:penicillin-insensitive murein DD-endopeptidase
MYKIITLSFMLLASSLYGDESICYGTTSNGRLENGVQLPMSGENFTNYSMVGVLSGRTYVHSKVRDIVTAAYKALEVSMPNRVYKYAETGHKEGGSLYPHKTHQNGLSVDFMVPVKDKAGISVHLPTNPLNKFGYGIEFDSKGHYDEYTIDYEAMAAHIVSLHKEAQKAGVKIWRVIFDPKLQKYLFATKQGDYLKRNINFSKKRSWVRHDEHYHVDFIVPCRKL